MKFKYKMKINQILKKFAQINTDVENFFAREAEVSRF